MFLSLFSLSLSLCLCECDSVTALLHESIRRRRDDKLGLEPADRPMHLQTQMLLLYSCFFCLFEVPMNLYNLVAVSLQFANLLQVAVEYEPGIYCSAVAHSSPISAVALWEEGEEG
jgi:hypothetical protein